MTELTENEIIKRTIESLWYSSWNAEIHGESIVPREISSKQSHSEREVYFNHIKQILIKNQNLRKQIEELIKENEKSDNAGEWYEGYSFCISELRDIIGEFLEVKQ